MLVVTAMAIVALATSAAALDGAWGDRGDDGAQVTILREVVATNGMETILGDPTVGFYWRNSYHYVSSARFSADGKTLTFAFKGGNAVLTRAGENMATLTVTDADGTARLLLKRD
jgi:hypothetical protein